MLVCSRPDDMDSTMTAAEAPEKTGDGDSENAISSGVPMTTPAASGPIFPPLMDFLAENRETIRSILRSRRGTELRVFGSVARGDDSPDSDVDFLVTLEEDASLSDHMGLRRDLKELLGRHVDLVTMRALMTARSGIGFHYRDRILREAKLVCR